MRTRRKGRWLLKQPRLGARMCQGTFFFNFNLKQSELLTGDERISEFMKLREILGLSAALLLCLTGCADKTVSGEHEAVTILAPFLDCDRLAELVHEKYPEVNLEILSYSGANTTEYLQNMLAADDLPDICTQTVYDPNISDMSDKMIGLPERKAPWPIRYREPALEWLSPEIWLKRWAARSMWRVNWGWEAALRSI